MPIARFLIRHPKRERQIVWPFAQCSRGLCTRGTATPSQERDKRQGTRRNCTVRRLENGRRTIGGRPGREKRMEKEEAAQDGRGERREGKRIFVVIKSLRFFNSMRHVSASETRTSSCTVEEGGSFCKMKKDETEEQRRRKKEARRSGNK